MRFLIAEMLLLLIAAFALGLVVGLLLGRLPRRGDDTGLEVEQARLRALLRSHGIDPDPPPVGAVTLDELESWSERPDDLIDLEPLDDP